MSAWRRLLTARERPPPKLGDDHADVPDPLGDPEPPPDRYCDLVLTGGVASGVVYPWALLELARAFRFKNIGGTSVGAMAAALGAAAEYGRRNGYRYAFETLRALPGLLAEPVGDGKTQRTRLQALFQPSRHGRRLFAVFLDGVEVFARETKATQWQTWRWAGRTFAAFVPEALNGALVALGVLALVRLAGPYGLGGLLAGAAIVLLGAIGGALHGLHGDVRRGLIRNQLGLVTGGPVDGHDPDDDPGLTLWLHRGIQRSAGLKEDGRPLTFGDLWHAPESPGAPPAERRADVLLRPDQRSINLEMVTTNVTHGRPYRLPIDDESSQLYFKFDEFELFFPPDVMKELKRVARPYQPRSASDPPGPQPGYFELPGEHLPIVVAARLSLSFPLLFSALPLHAVDYEMTPRESRVLKRCRFSDGGICSNFPIHLFDAAAPNWPTFGLWLDKRSPYHPDSWVWLPRHHREGRGDRWRRFENDDDAFLKTGERVPGDFGRLVRFLVSAVFSAKNWGDHTAMRMPHARNRVVRLNLRRGEGELNIAMPRRTILEMAQHYGTRAGRKLVEDFSAEAGQPPKPAWNEHQWVRLHVLLSTLRGLLRGLADDSRHAAHTTPLRELIARSVESEPLAVEDDKKDPAAVKTKPEHAAALVAMLDAAEVLEAALIDNEVELPYRPVPTPALRVRPPI